MAPRSWQCLICGCVFWSIHGIIQEPQHIRFNSVMLDTVLQWDPPNFSEGNVTYTVQYKDFRSQFTDLCRRIYITKCNISSIPKYVLSHLRIRAEFENMQSHWINLTFTPFKDTIITPPTVQIVPTKPGVLNVHLESASVILNGNSYSLKEFYGSVIYMMKIWMKDDGSEQIIHENAPYTFHVISGLNPGIMYCLKAQVFIEELNKTGEWSEVCCAQTTNSGTDPVAMIVILLTVLASFSFCCCIIVCIYQRIKFSFFPSYSLPQHFLQFVSQPPYSSQFLASQLLEEDLNYDTIVVLSEESKQGNSELENKIHTTKQTLQASQDAVKPKEISNCTT